MKIDLPPRRVVICTKKQPRSHVHLRVLRQRLFHDGRLHEFLHIVPQHGRRAGHESCHDHQEVPRAVLMTVGGYL